MNPYDPETLSLMADALRSCLEMLRRASLERGSVRGFCLSKSLQARYLVSTPRGF
jgi:hypothetical protein